MKGFFGDSVFFPFGRISLLALVFHFSLVSWAEVREQRSMAAVPLSSDGTIEKLMESPMPKASDWIYEDYFSRTDTSVARGYEDRWERHEQQVSALSDYSRQPIEMGLRSQMANEILRVRVDAAMKAYFHPSVNVPEHLKQSVKEVHQKMEQVKNTSISLSKEPSLPRIQLGYDFLLDSSKVELVGKSWGAGVYHTRFLGSFSGSADPLALSFRVSAALGWGMPTASLAYRPGGDAVEGALSRQLSPVLNAQVSTLQVFKPTAREQRYNVSLGYAF